MIRKNSLDCIGDFFDANLNLCEEYELFMRVLYRSKAAYIDEPLAVYRVHPDMGSLKFIERWPDEMAYIIEKFEGMDYSFKEKYKAGIAYMNAKIGYYRARAEMMNNNRIKAREHLYPFRMTDYRFYLLYLITYCPSRIWHAIHSFMAEGAFSGTN